jgi:hypothetical protein
MIMINNNNNIKNTVLPTASKIKISPVPNLSSKAT